MSENIFQQIVNHTQETFDAERAHGYPALVDRQRGAKIPRFVYTPGGTRDQLASERARRNGELGYLIGAAKAVALNSPSYEAIKGTLDRVALGVRILTLGHPGEDLAGKRPDLESRITAVVYLMQDVHHYATAFQAAGTGGSPAKTSGQPTDKALVSLGRCNYRIGEHTLVVEPKEDIILQAFAKHAGKDARWIPMDKQTLIQATQDDEDAPRRLGAMRTKYPVLAPVIDCPGRKGRGGYKILVQQPAKRRVRSS